MPERGRHHQRSDVYDEYNSREGDYSHNRDHASYDSRGPNQKPRHIDERGSAGDRRVKQNRQRDVTTASHMEPPDYTDHDHEGPSRLSRVTSVYHSEGEYYERQHGQALYNLRYILTSRGLCQLMELFVNLLIVICAGVPYSNNGGYRDLASLGGLYYYQFGGANAFTGADADRVKELDLLFHQLKRPPYAFTMACGGVLMIYVCAMLALGIFRVPYRWPPVLLGEALLNFLIGLGYIPALAFYFIKLQETYSDPICEEREKMYKSKGHNGFECQFHGADIAGGLFGVLGVFVFIFGAVLAVRAFRSVRELKKQRTNEDNNF
ncbi:MARVEL domain-containing protein 3 isoform X2 [Siniperca chuatsi]|nr:MARVEL domain-containing protein 3 isoform X2 [Siniperca chuatsi]XP_044063085.1 MARVEL domain-containing protein 3 isoform X2 [Siniperca chuatsi]XP_044063094.1 MARVEL domain-containing protein 3 isoform X2 [Siniperca chuatsi]XP_044063105.1 MARVEL domain-containing protein 3 isoform X2 [Siniperca chuatsi]XP_044063114.1 MARVEL domain-containing protein 3 isoform X2 [Siniperca chuatsi]XP_044063120.1 MARVEL domain-containing protein 3 isoform X2 [Siniperca chuatsi]